MKTQDFAMLMFVLVAILFASLFFGKCSCNKPQPQQHVATVDSITTYYQPALNILKAQRYQDSLIIAKTSNEVDSLHAVVNERNKRINRFKSTLAQAEAAKDTPAIVQEQKNIIQQQDSVIYNQDQQLTLQSNIIQRQQTTIATYATEVELYKGIAKQVSDENVIVKNQNTQLIQQNNKLTKKVERKNGVIKTLATTVIVEGIIILITTL